MRSRANVGTEGLAAPAQPMGKRSYMVVYGRHIAIPHLFKPGPLGEHARWVLEIDRKHDRPGWLDIMRGDYQPFSDIEFVEVRPVHEALGLLLALYALWRMLPWHR